MMLSDRTIENMAMEQDLITPYSYSLLNPCSYDLTLDPLLLIPKTDLIITAGKKQHYSHKYVDEYKLAPGDFILASTKEWIELPDNIQARVDGKSSIGRLGLFIQNAGFIDPGFKGTITLELFNASKSEIDLSTFDRIAQISFFTLDQDAEQPYHGKYQCQNETTGSREYKASHPQSVNEG